MQTVTHFRITGALSNTLDSPISDKNSIKWQFLSTRGHGASLCLDPKDSLHALQTFLIVFQGLMLGKKRRRERMKEMEDWDNRKKRRK